MATVSGRHQHRVLPGSLRTGPSSTSAGPPFPARTAAATASAAAMRPASSDVVAVGVIGVLAAEQAHGGADLAAAARLLDAAVLEAQAERVAVLDEHLGEVAATRQGAGDDGLEQTGVEARDVHSAALELTARARRRGL